ncbi:MAG: hypothetical protein GC152_02355 [Alphaproteobacteria bacterium]|nr:hypothetical protein [Alphaproteobacteria bacterium]
MKEQMLLAGAALYLASYAAMSVDVSISENNRPSVRFVAPALEVRICDRNANSESARDMIIRIKMKRGDDPSLPSCEELDAPQSIDQPAEPAARSGVEI